LPKQQKWGLGHVNISFRKLTFAQKARPSQQQQLDVSCAATPQLCNQPYMVAHLCVEPPAGGHLDGGRHAQSHAADDVLLDVLQVLFHSGRRQALDGLYLEEAKRNHHTCDAHLVPRAVLATPSARCSTSSARKRLRQVMDKSRRDTSTRRPRASRARAHAGGAADRAAHPTSWPCGQEGANGRHRPRLEVEGGPSSRRSRRAAADTKGNEADQGGVRGGAPTWLYC